jgi:glycosyltransferase involved in cell wall biosynthesis
MLAVIETHPIQYHAPVYRALQRDYGVPVTAVYGSDFSLRRHRDREFGSSLSWEVDLLGGYEHEFLSRADRDAEPVRVSGSGLSAVLRRLAPSATLITGYSPAFHRRAWMAAWRLGAPILFRGEASDVAQTRRSMVRVTRDIGLRVAYRRCARVLYIGERARRHYRALGVEDERLVFSPYCVDTLPFATSDSDRTALRPVARAGLGLGDDDFVLLFSGKLSARKGVDLMIEAVRTLPADLRSRTVVVCAGDGAARAELSALAAREPKVDLRVLGVQLQTALSQWYHMADLLVLPSRYAETWGLVVNEALHHGLPCVVSSCVGCAPDLIDSQTGVVFEAESIASLGDAIRSARLLVGRADIRNACRAKVAAYSVDKAAAGLAEAYRAAVGGTMTS